MIDNRPFPIPLHVSGRW